MRLVRYFTGVAAAAAMVVGVAACGSSSSSSSSGSSSSGGGAAVTAFAQKAQSTAAQASAKQTAMPPATGPKAVAGKSIFVIPCAMAAEGCAGPAREAMTAAGKIGWHATLIDPQGDPTKQAAAIQQAIAAKADGIVLEAIDAGVIAGPLQQAKAAGIKIVTFASVDQGHLFNQEIPDDSQFAVEGYDLAAAMYGQAKGNLQLVMMTGTDSRVVTYR